jgi:Flp pilus assembly protein TadD
MIEVASFLMKRKRNEDALRVLANVTEENRTADYYLLMGHLKCDVNDYQQAIQQLNAADDTQTALYDRALKGYARALFASERYEEALNTYRQMLDRHPDQRDIQLNAAICQVNIGKYEDALKTLFRLNYEDAADNRVERALAWALTLAGRYDQAVKLYDSMLAVDHKEPSDVLNYGYCLWFQKDVAGAVSLFRQYLNMNEEGLAALEHEFTVTEHAMLQKHGISDTELQLMLDVLSQ